MGSIIFILFYILLIFETIWWFTCVKRENIALILQLLVFIVSLIPVIHIFASIIFIIVCAIEVESYDLELKNNWFNRKFLAYRE